MKSSGIFFDELSSIVSFRNALISSESRVECSCLAKSGCISGSSPASSFAAHMRVAEDEYGAIAARANKPLSIVRAAMRIIAPFFTNLANAIVQVLPFLPLFLFIYLFIYLDYNDIIILRVTEREYTHSYLTTANCFRRETK